MFSVSTQLSKHFSKKSRLGFTRIYVVIEKTKKSLHRQQKINNKEIFNKCFPDEDFLLRMASPSLDFSDVTLALADAALLN